GTDVRVQLVLPGAVISEGWDVAGGAELDPLPDEIVMTTQDLVDAALAGLDIGEQVTAPSLQMRDCCTIMWRQGHKRCSARSMPRLPRVTALPDIVQKGRSASAQTRSHPPTSRL